MENKKTSQRKKLIIVLCVVLSVLILAIGGFAIWYFTSAKEAGFTDEEQALFDEIQSVIDKGVFIEGISVDGVDIGGMTMVEARAAVDEAHKEQLDKLEYTFNIDDETIVIKQSNSFIVNYDLTRVLNEAFNCIDYTEAREAMEEYKDIKENGREFNTDPKIDEQSLKDRLEYIASSYTDEPQDATWKINMDAPEGKKLEFIEGRSGVVIDTDAMYNTIVELFEKGEGGSLEVSTKVQEPEITKADLEKKYQFRASAETSYDTASRGYASRVHNIVKATNYVNGTILKPGEVFSMNNTIGDRTYANGWQAGGALVGGKTEQQAGGGVCQVASTLYNAIVKADLEIVYRQNHSEQLGYVQGGLDATINTGTIDFKFKNNTGSDILIIGYNVNRHVYFEVYGEPFGDEYDKITLTSKMTGTVYPSGEMQYKVVKGKPASYSQVDVKRKNGSKWVSYKNYWKDGKLVKTEFLANSTYKAFNGVTLVGEGNKNDPDASAKPSPTNTAKPTQTTKPTQTPKPTQTANPTQTAKPTQTTNPTQTPDQTKDA